MGPRESQGGAAHPNEKQEPAGAAPRTILED
jgi:hypothetical protein